MERVAFLIEETNERLSCLLNPETLVIRRLAGLRPREAVHGQLARAGLTDDPLLQTGGGRTELELDLLFDVSLAGSSITTDNVRDLTGPFWRLAENAVGDDGYRRPPLVRFIWGRSWNIPCAVVAVAERLDDFTPEGVPRRSWLRMRMLRVNETSALDATAVTAPPPEAFDLDGAQQVPEESVRVHEITGGASAGTPTEALQALAEDMQVDEGTLTPSGLVSSVLAETSAGARLDSAGRAISSAADIMTSDLRSLIAVIGETPAVQAIRSGIDTIASNIRSMAAASKMRIVEAMNTAAAEISTAAQEMTSALKTLGSGVVKPIVNRIEAALQRVASAVEAVRQAARTIVSAVKERLARAIAWASDKLQTSIATIRSTLERISTTASAVVARAVGMVRSAVGSIESVLERVVSAGDTAAIKLIPAAVAEIGSGIELLWSAGEEAAARAMGAPIKVIVFAFKLVTAAVKAVASAIGARTAETVALAVTRIRPAVTGMRPLENTEAKDKSLSAIRQDLEMIDDTVASSEYAAQTTAVTEIPEATRTIRSVLEDLEPESEARVGQALGAIAQAVQAIREQEQAALDKVVRSALAEETQFAAAAADMERALAAKAKISLGERLDQIAFQAYGNPAFWRLLATFNDIERPLIRTSGSVLRIPPLSVLRAR